MTAGELWGQINPSTTPSPIEAPTAEPAPAIGAAAIGAQVGAEAALISPAEHTKAIESETAQAIEDFVATSDWGEQFGEHYTNLQEISLQLGDIDKQIADLTLVDVGMPTTLPEAGIALAVNPGQLSVQGWPYMLGRMAFNAIKGIWERSENQKEIDGLQNQQKQILTDAATMEDLNLQLYSEIGRAHV